MATLWVLNKPTGFTFPSTYERKEIETSEEYSGNNYSFVKPLNLSSSIKSYLIGEYLEMKETKDYPEATNLVERDFQYPTLLCFGLYIPDDEPKIFCIGNNLDIIIDILKRHSNSTSFSIIPIDLDLIEEEFRNGRIGISGHKYTSEQGTIRNIVRKVQAEAFDPDDPHYLTGEDIEKEYLEVLVNFDGINKRFNICANGKITSRGKPIDGQNSFFVLKTVYDRIMEIIS